jgi:hypothetical protein
VDRRAQREQEWAWSRIGLVRRALLGLVGIAILGLVAMIAWGVVAGQAR